MRAFPPILGAVVFSLLSADDPSRRPANPWQSEVAEAISLAEYEFSEQADGSFSAPNRAHDLRATIADGGFEVVSRTGGSERFLLRLRLRRIGRESGPEAPLSGRISANHGRAEIARGNLSESFLNDDRGLEHGFTLNKAPSHGHGRVLLEMTLGGTMLGYLEADRRGVLFKDAQGLAALRYGALSVIDARGIRQSASLEVISGGLSILIEDRDAAYPLTIASLLTSPSWQVESDQAAATLGFSVSVAGDVNGDGFSDVIVGAPLYDNNYEDEGRALLYLGSSGGLSTSPAWTADGNQAGASFAFALGAAGDVNGDGFDDVAIGAPMYDDGEADEGAAFVYLGSPNGLSSSFDWIGEGNESGAHLGLAVAGAGDIAGDGFTDLIAGGVDRVLVFDGSAAGLSLSPSWSASIPAADLGRAVGTAGDVNGDGYDDIVAGASSFSNVELLEGAVFVWFGGAAGLGDDGDAGNVDWGVEGNQPGARFGSSVSTAGDVNGDGYADLIVGSFLYDNIQVDEGRVSIHLGSSSGPALSPSWIFESNQDGAHLGSERSILTAGDVNGDGFADVVVGAPDYDNGHTDEGRAWIFVGSPTGPSATPVWSAEGDQGGAGYGGAVATAGDVDGDGFSDVLVGAPGFDNGELEEGRAFLYSGSPLGLAAIAAWNSAGHNQQFANFSSALASAGDVNGDGYSDVIVGAYRFDSAGSDRGRAYLYLGSPSGLSLAHAWLGDGAQAGAQFGAGVSAAGDVNGDGYGDVIVGAPLNDNGQTDEGIAYVYLGSASGLSVAAAWSAESDQGGARFGSAVAAAGDVNADGFGDVIVSAGSAGRAYVYGGSPTGPTIAPVWIGMEGGAAGYGASVSAAGDVNGDGFTDVIVGAPGAQRAFVYQGSPSGPGGTSSWIGQGTGSYGASVASAGDVNGDGFSDVVIGSPLFSTLGEVGRAQLYNGSPTGLPPDPSWTVQGVPTGFGNQARLGSSVASAGDVNGDGFGDVIVGAPFGDNGQSDEGIVYVYLGSTSGLSPVAAWSAESNQTNTAGVGAHLGRAVASAGDVNGDGLSDVLAGSDWDFCGNCQPTDEGRAFLYYGGGGDGLDRIPRQARSDSSGPIALLGRSDSDTAFRIQALGRTPAGRGRVRLVWQAASFGIPFDSGLSGESASADTGAPAGGRSAIPLNGVVEPLEPATVYRWRARLAAANPLFPRSPWLSLPGNSISESKLRTAGCTSADTDGDGLSQCTGDCNDLNTAVYPGAPEICDGSRNDCSAPGWPSIPQAERDGDGDAFYPCQGDCDDTRAVVYAGAPQICDGINDNCNDPSWPTVPQDEVDADLDTFSTCEGDCDDTVADAWSAPGEVTTLDYMAAGPISSVPRLFERDLPNAGFGRSVALADVNGDGFADVIVGAPNGVGRVELYLGSASGVASTPAWTRIASQSGSQYGFAVASAGDVNNDGRDDVVIGAYLNDAGGLTDNGLAELFLGTAAGLPSGPAWSITGAANSNLGYSIASAGDVNRDNRADVIIGSPKDINGGRASVYLGTATGLATTPVWTIADEFQPTAQFGSSVASAGDVNGDRFDDVIVGAPGILLSAVGQGVARMYLGSNFGPATTPSWWFYGSQLEGNLGSAVSSAGDVNGDGADDVLVGERRFDAGGQVDRGRAHLFLGSKVNGQPPLGSSPVWTVEGNAIQAFLGSAVASAGDVDHDGFGDILVGMSSESGFGAAFFYRGSAAGPSTAPSWSVVAEQFAALYGISLQGGRDVDGDGWSDLIVGAPNFDAGQTNEGRALLYRGRPPSSEPELIWPTVGSLGSSSIVYDLLRSTNPADFVNGTICVVSDDAQSLGATDAAVPPLDSIFYYLVRADNACPSSGGSLGTTSAGTPRLGRSCP